MARQVNVLQSDAPHIGEATTRRVPIFDEDGDALALAGLDLYVRISRQAGADALLEKTTADDITVEDTSYMAIAFGPSDFDAWQAGPYYWEGWSSTDEVMLFYGDFWLLPGSPEAA